MIIEIHSRTHGTKEVLIDDADWPTISKHTWCILKHSGTCYASTGIRVNGKKTTLMMHRLLLPSANMVDHVNGNGLDNRRENIRPATASLNGGNRRKLAPASSTFKGVVWHKKDRRWHAYVKLSGKKLFLGCHTHESDAARAYDAAARKHFGEFARLNFPEGT